MVENLANPLAGIGNLNKKLSDLPSQFDQDRSAIDKSAIGAPMLKSKFEKNDSDE
jgi:hypothetical protein